MTIADITRPKSKGPKAGGECERTRLDVLAAGHLLQAIPHLFLW